MWPSIDRNAMGWARYLGSPASPRAPASRAVSAGASPASCHAARGRPFARLRRRWTTFAARADRTATCSDRTGPPATAVRRRGPLIVPEQGDHLAERTFVIDALAEEARDQNGDDQRPGDSRRSQARSRSGAAGT